MNVYVDESGDLGARFQKGSSATFVLSAVLVEDPDQVVAALATLRRSLGKPDYEFKFSEMSDAARKRFFLAIAGQEWHASCRVLDKRRLIRRVGLTPTDLYVRILTYALKDMLAELVHANVVIDEIAKTRLAQRQLTDRIRRELCLSPSESTTIHDIRFANSRAESLVQVADMVTGAVARAHTKADDRFIKLIPSRRLAVATILA